MRFLLIALLFFATASCCAAAPQAVANQAPTPNAMPSARPQAPPPGLFFGQPADARRMEYDINTLRSMLYQMKSDLSRVQDSAARSALLVDSQMWEWVIADMQRQVNAMRMPQSPPPPGQPVRPAEPPTPRGVRSPNQ